MTRTYTGGCACGAIRYEKHGAPVAELLCQCLHCQKRSGAGHSAYLAFAGRADLAVTGAVRTWGVAGDSGGIKNHAFCAVCGTPVFVTFDAMPDLVALHAGSLDDPAVFGPAFVTYGVRGHAWDSLAQGMQVFDRMPPG